MRRFGGSAKSAGVAVSAVALLVGMATQAEPAAATQALPVVATIEAGQRPGALIVDDERGAWYVLDFMSNEVRIYSTGSNALVKAIAVPGDVSTLLLDDLGNDLYVTSRATSGGGSVTVIDADHNTVTDTLVLSGEPGTTMALDAEGERLYVPETFDGRNTDAIDVVDTAARRVIGTIAVPKDPVSPVLDTARHRLYVSSLDVGVVTVIDTRSGRRLATVKVGRNAHFLLLDAAHRRLFAVRASGLSVVDTRTNRRIATVRIPISIEEGPPALDRVRNRLYAASWSNGGVAVIDTRRNTVVARIPVAGAPDSPVLDVSRDLLFVTDFDEGAGHTVTVINTMGNTVISTASVGEGPQRVGLDTTTRLLYVPNWASGTVSIVDTSSIT